MSKYTFSALNYLNAGRLYATGAIKLITAGLATETGIGAPAAVGLLGTGLWNIKSAMKAEERGNKMWSDAQKSNDSGWEWKNFNGLLPYGTEYDDPCEPSIFDFWKNKLKNWYDKPVEFFEEIGTML